MDRKKNNSDFFALNMSLIMYLIHTTVEVLQHNMFNSDRVYKKLKINFQYVLGIQFKPAIFLIKKK